MNIGIAGVGGIGSNVAVNLVRSGIEALTIVDFDRVEPSNLNRQFYFADQLGRFKVDALRDNLQRIRPELRVDAVVARIDRANCERFFAACGLIVEGFDRGADKKMLLEILGAERIVVSACGIAGGELDAIRTRRLGNCYIVGDFITDCAEAPLFAHKVATVANHMSAILLQQRGLVHGTAAPA